MTRLNRETWGQLIDEFEASHESQQSFADRKGVSVATFRQWLYKLRQERAQPPAFLPVRVLSASTAAEPPRWLELELRSGLRLRFSPGTEPSYLAALAAALP